MCASRPARPRNTSSHEPMALALGHPVGHPVFMRLLDNALSAGKQDMPGGGTENNIAINTTRRTTGRIKFCFIRHVQRLTRTIKTNGSEHSDLSMDDVTQLFPQLSVGRRFTFPTYEFSFSVRPDCAQGRARPTNGSDRGSLRSHDLTLFVRPL